MMNKMKNSRMAGVWIDFVFPWRQVLVFLDEISLALGKCRYSENNISITQGSKAQNIGMIAIHLEVESLLRMFCFYLMIYTL